MGPVPAMPRHRERTQILEMRKETATDTEEVLCKLNEAENSG